MSKLGSPLDVLNQIGGFSGSVISHCHMFEVPASCVVALINTYQQSSETLAVYAPLLDMVPQFKVASGSKSSNVNDLAEALSKKSNFISLLKESNTRDHNIFN
jgi:hypothetical protein